jgi:large subunit ribosomal protein L10
MNKTEKQQVIATLGEKFRTINSVFLIDYRGLKVVDATELRRKIREMNGSYVVIKNTIALRAAKETKLEHLSGHFRGPTALAYHPRDVVGLAKLLTDIAKTNPNIQFKAALIEGKVVATSDIQAIASMPSREVMLGRLLSLMKAPAQRLAVTLRAPLRDLSLVLKQIQKQV